jgi:hypothetical protein
MNLAFEWRQCPDCRLAVFVEIDGRKVVDFRHPAGPCVLPARERTEAMAQLNVASRFELIPTRQNS